MGCHLERDERARVYHVGVRACITWLHAHAATMNDPHAASIINSAAWQLGQSKPPPVPEEISAHSPSEASAGNLPPDEPLSPSGGEGEEGSSRTNSGGSPPLRAAKSDSPSPSGREKP